MATGLKNAAVIGFPVAHSLSPRIHQYWMRHLDIQGEEYKKIEVLPGQLEPALAEMKAAGLRGFNVTIPHKEAILPLLDEVREDARAIGAVNTVVYENGKAVGYNTDLYGFSQNLKQQIGNLELYKHHALILGAGGAARASVLALRKEGWQGTIAICNRTGARAEVLGRFFEGTLKIIPWEQRNEALAEATLLVNTTSQGMKGQEALDLSLDALSREALVTDIVYNPLVTSLLAQAQARGNPTVDGLGMLLYQAQEAFRLWYGVTPEVTPELRKHVLEGL